MEARLQGQQLLWTSNETFANYFCIRPSDQGAFLVLGFHSRWRQTTDTSTISEDEDQEPKRSTIDKAETATARPLDGRCSLWSRRTAYAVLRASASGTGSNSNYPHENTVERLHRFASKAEEASRYYASASCARAQGAEGREP
ncbi:hypothetical protein ACKRZS_013146 [Fusarium odoratissimum]